MAQTKLDYEAQLDAAMRKGDPIEEMVAIFGTLSELSDRKTVLLALLDDVSLLTEWLLLHNKLNMLAVTALASGHRPVVRAGHRPAGCVISR